MVKRLKAFYLVVLGAVCLLGAKNESLKPASECGKPELTGVHAKAIPEEYKQLLIEAEPIVQNILTALNEENYDHYIRDFSAVMKRGYTKEIFRKNTVLIKEKIGIYVASILWKMERLGQNYILYYHARFSKAGDPVVIRLVVQRVEGLLRVAFLSFDSPALKDIGQPKTSGGGITDVNTAH